LNIKQNVVRKCIIQKLSIIESVRCLVHPHINGF
jgi:hypothetical protein